MADDKRFNLIGLSREELKQIASDLGEKIPCQSAFSLAVSSWRTKF